MTAETVFATVTFFGGLGYFGAALASALGVGASLLFVPVLLVLLPAFGVATGDAPGVAIATSLAASSAVTAAGAWAHWKAGNVCADRLRAAYPAMAAAALGALVGGMFVTSAPGSSLIGAVVAAQLIVAGMLVVRLVRDCSCERGCDVSTDDNITTVLRQARTQAYVFAVGALTSIGAGGVFLVPYFVWRGAAKARAAALASILGMSITPVATAVYVFQHESVPTAGVIGLVHAPVALALAVGAVFGAGVGARAAKSANTAVWTRLLAAALLLSSVRAAAKML